MCSLINNANSGNYDIATIEEQRFKNIMLCQLRLEEVEDYMLKKICKILNSIIMLILLILIGLFFVPKIFGCENLAVLSGSMEPEIPVGAMIIIQEDNPEDLEIGDIITYRIDDSTMVTHRIVNIDQKKREIVTKGDANNTVDGTPISFTDVVGKMLFSVPLLGYLSIYIQSGYGIYLIFAIFVILLILNFLPDIIDKLNKK